MGPILVLVGDRGRARLFRLEQDVPDLEEIRDMVNPALHVQERKLARDRQGRSFKASRGSHVALGDEHKYKHLGAARFAREVANAVQECCREQPYARIYMVADPEFTGLMRPQLAAKRLKTPLIGIPKNLTRHPVAEIRGHLPRDPWKRRATWMGV
jgi:protein required for attachment to host cells